LINFCKFIKNILSKIFSLILLPAALLTMSSTPIAGANNLENVNSDGKANSSDLYLLKSYLFKLVNESSINSENADLNNDGRIQEP